MSELLNIQRGPRRARRRIRGQEALTSSAQTVAGPGDVDLGDEAFNQARHHLGHGDLVPAGGARQTNGPTASRHLLEDDAEGESDHGFGTELQNERDANDIPSDDVGDEDDEELPGLGEDEEVDEEDYEVEDANEHQAEEQSPENFFDPVVMGLKEINNLAHFGVSSHKPGNGVEELLSDDTDKYWQSDGQQPHILTMHFLRRVEIRAIRFYVDYQQDESYTPTNIALHAGTGPHDLLQFAELTLASPSGWQDVPLVGCGGGVDGNSLCCWIVQMHVKENLQNGKDTHIRGIRVFALDENADGRINSAVTEMVGNMDEAMERELERRTRGRREDARLGRTASALAIRVNGAAGWAGEGGFSTLPEFMRDPEIR